MANSWVVKAGTLLACAVATACLAWWLGTAYGRHQVESEKAAARTEWERMLAKDDAGIAVGHPFPSFPVWSSDGAHAIAGAHEMLPNGGILIAVSPSCHACLDVASAFQEASDSYAGTACPLALLLEGQSPDELLSALTAKFSALPVFIDPEQSLIHIYKIVENPSYFVVDGSGIVRYAGFGQRSAMEYSLLIRKYCSPSDVL